MNHKTDHKKSNGFSMVIPQVSSNEMSVVLSFWALPIGSAISTIEFDGEWDEREPELLPLSGQGSSGNGATVELDWPLKESKYEGLPMIFVCVCVCCRLILSARWKRRRRFRCRPAHFLSATCRYRWRRPRWVWFTPIAVRMKVGLWVVIIMHVAAGEIVGSSRSGTRPEGTPEEEIVRLLYMPPPWR